MTAAVSLERSRLRGHIGRKHWLARIAAIAPAVIVIALAASHLLDGLAREAAFPAAILLDINELDTRTDYVVAATALSHAPSRDGEAHIWQAEAELRSGAARESVIPIVTDGLSHDPASARGWIVYAAALGPRAPQRAASALSLAIELARYEYFEVGPRVLAGTPIWNYLSADVQDTLIGDGQLLIADPEFQDTLRTLLRVPGGPQLVKKAFGMRAQQLRNFNRDLARERLGL